MSTYPGKWLQSLAIAILFISMGPHKLSAATTTSLCKADIRNSQMANDQMVLPMSQPTATEQDAALTADQSGNIHLVWRRGQDLWYATYRNAKWQNIQPVPEGTGVAPSIAVLPSGSSDTPDVLIVWQNGYGNQAQLRYSLARFETEKQRYRWSTPKSLTTDDHGDIDPMIIAQSGAEPLVLWRQRNWDHDDDLDIYYDEVDVTLSANDWVTTRTMMTDNPMHTIDWATQQTPNGEQYCLGYTQDKATSIPALVPVIGGKYGFTLFGEACVQDPLDKPICDLYTSSRLGANVMFTERVTGSGFGILTAHWKTDRDVGQYMFDSAYLKNVKATVTGRVPAVALDYSPVVEVDVGGLIRGSVAGNLDWDIIALPNPPELGRIDLYGEAGLYGEALFFRTFEGSVTGTGGMSAVYIPPKNLELTGYCLRMEAKAGLLIWRKTWGTGCPGSALLQNDELLQETIGATMLFNKRDEIDGVPITEALFIAQKPIQGTHNVYEGHPLLPDSIASDHAHDGNVSIAHNQYGEILAAWSKEMPFRGSLESAVMVSSFDGVKWSVPEQLLGAGYLNREPALAFDAENRPFLLWAGTPVTIKPSATTADIADSLNGTEIYFSQRLDDGWTSPRLVASTPGQDDNVKIAADSTGRILASWIHKADQSDTVFTSIWDGKQWSEPVESAVAGKIASMEVISAKKSFLMVWSQLTKPHDQTTDQQALQYATWTGTNWSTPAKVTQPISTLATGNSIFAPPETMPIMAKTNQVTEVNGALFPPFDPPAMCLPPNSRLFLPIIGTGN